MKSKMPLIRLSAINPLLNELKKRNLDVSALLSEFEMLTEVPVSSKLFVSSETMYELVERCGDLSGDALFGYSVGASLNIEDWAVMSVAAAKANTVGELLIQISLNSGEHTSSTEYFLQTQGETSVFGFRREIRPPRRPGHNDAFYFGLLNRIMKVALRESWDPSRMRFKVSAIENIPRGGDGCRVVEGDWLGVKIDFPTEWLFAHFEPANLENLSRDAHGEAIPRSFVDSIRAALEPHLHDEHLTADKVAIICGYERRRLSRELRNHGTTISRELASLRAERAGAALVSTDRPVAEVAAQVGFRDPNVFSRAFKKWTGQSPRDYRRAHRPSN